MSNPFELIEARLVSIESLLHDIKFGSLAIVANDPAEDILTVPQVAAFLNLAVPTIYSLISKKEIPVMKKNGRCYFLKTELIEYLKAGRKKTNTEIEAEAADYVGNKKRSR